MTLSPNARKWIRAVVDYGGLVAWIAAYFLTGKNLVNSTWALVGGSFLGLVVGLVFERRIAFFPLFGCVAGLVFGGLTLFYHDAIFLKEKPTVMNLLYGVILLGSLAMKKAPLKLLLGEAFPMTDTGWRILSLRFGLFFLAMAGLNEIVWRTQPEAQWVLFKFPGLMILTVIFSMTQAPVMMKHAHQDSPEA